MPQRPSLHAVYLRFSRLRPGPVLLTSFLYVVGVALLDAFIEQRFSVSLSAIAAYLPAVAIAAWVCGRKVGLQLASFAFVLDLLVHVTQPSHARLDITLIDIFLQGVVLVLLSEASSWTRTLLRFEQENARNDTLTGVGNARGFEDIADMELERMRRYKHELTVVYLDVDNFKKINDTYGHSKGDEVLRLIGATLRNTVRAVDYVARMGGDEFVVLLPESDSLSAKGFINRLKDALQKATNGEVTVSIGAVTFGKPPDKIDTLLGPADAMMYAAKKSGKNTIVFDSSVPAAAIN